LHNLLILHLIPKIDSGFSFSTDCHQRMISGVALPPGARNPSLQRALNDPMISTGPYHAILLGASQLKCSYNVNIFVAIRFLIGYIGPSKTRLAPSHNARLEQGG
jgi:hypothetical protein